LEHYTAIIAEMLLRDPDVQSKFSAEARQLWLWHALEENEHKTVAYDVYEKVVGSYALRDRDNDSCDDYFLCSSTCFSCAFISCRWPIINVRQNASALKYLWNGKKGVFSRLLPKYLDFFKPSFHPKHHDTDALLASGAKFYLHPKACCMSNLKIKRRWVCINNLLLLTA
jgi:predicted metal-dependent hydrolase